MSKKWVSAVLVGLVLLIFLPSSQAGTEFFKIEDLRPGMKGVGRTCYRGTKPEEFQVEILGVLKGINPGASAVLAKFSGAFLEKTGIFEGMSGSPVFIDGKLLGAVAFSYSFAKEAIGGITPITQMVDAFEQTPDVSRGSSTIVVRKSSLWNFGPSPDPGFSKPLEIAPRDAKQQPVLASLGGHALVPIATPLSLGGFDAETLRVFEPKFRAMGMSTLQGAGGQGPDSKTGQEIDSAPLEPGSNIVVPLVRGDLDVSAGGTVTYVDGNRLYAFGHSMFQLGFTELPMYKARAITVFPSLESSFKILESGELAGSIRQDGAWGSTESWERSRKWCL